MAVVPKAGTHISTQFGVLHDNFGGNIHSALQSIFSGGNFLLRIDETFSFFQRRALDFCLFQHHLSQRFQTALAGNLGAGALFLLIGQIEVFKFL